MRGQPTFPDFFSTCYLRHFCVTRGNPVQPQNVPSGTGKWVACLQGYPLWDGWRFYPLHPFCMEKTKKPVTTVQVAIIAISLWVGFFVIMRLQSPSSITDKTPVVTAPSGQTNPLSPEAREGANRDTARACAEVQIRDMLKSPSTASFSWTPDISKWGQNYAVISYVDAENAFGATVRQHWQCRVTLGERDEDCVATCTFSGQ